MADEDVQNAVTILQDLGKFPSFPDRQQQGMLNQLFLARLMIHAHGFVSDAAFQDGSGNPVIDTSAVFYDGNSQGGIFGGTVHRHLAGHPPRRARRPGHELFAAAHPQHRLHGLCGAALSVLPERVSPTARPGAHPDALGPLRAERLRAPHDDRSAAQHAAPRGAAAPGVRRPPGREHRHRDRGADDRRLDPPAGHRRRAQPRRRFRTTASRRSRPTPSTARRSSCGTAARRRRRSRTRRRRWARIRTRIRATRRSPASRSRSSCSRTAPWSTCAPAHPVSHRRGRRRGTTSSP